MWKIIAIGTGIIGGFVGLIGLSEKRSYDALVSIGKVFDEMEKRNMLRYTTTELKQVVGRIPNEKWTDDHIRQLDDMYHERVKKCKKHWQQMNEELDIDREKHPEKYTSALSQLVRYGCPDYFYTGHEFEDQNKKIYDAYKCLEKDSDDKYYNDWVASEVKRLDLIKNKKIAEMFKSN